MHPFSLYDPTISLPMRPDTVTVAVLTVVSLVVPGVVIVLFCILLIPGPGAASFLGSQPRRSAASMWRIKLWEWNVGWMGLGLALAGAYTLTTFLKDLYGKPRPDLIARCDPDLSNISQYIVGGLSQQLDLAPIIVDNTICQNTDLHVLHDGFASFPSGHSSFSFAGLLYLSLWLAAKLRVSIPYVTSHHHRQPQQQQHNHNSHMHQGTVSLDFAKTAAMPPLWTLIPVSAPTITALFITASRWYDNRHHGFDIISGSVIGIFFAVLGFRFYQTPIDGADDSGGTGAAGFAWPPRRRGWWLGVGQSGGWTATAEEDNHDYDTQSPTSTRIHDEEQAFTDDPHSTTTIRNGGGGATTQLGYEMRDLNTPTKTNSDAMKFSSPPPPPPPPPSAAVNHEPYVSDGSSYRSHGIRHEADAQGEGEEEEEAPMSRESQKPLNTGL